VFPVRYELGFYVREDGFLHSRRVLRTVGNVSRRSSARDLHVAVQIPYVCHCITKLCRQQAEVIRNLDNGNFRNIGQGETPHRMFKTLILGDGHVYDCSSVLIAVMASGTINTA
jgi:hypothetical protein